MDATLNAIANVVVAVAAIMGLGGAGAYMIRRRANGQPALPGSAYDETLRELRGIHQTLRDGFRENGKQHEQMLDTLAPRRRD